MKADTSYRTVNFMCKIAQILNPTEPMTLSEWANNYMILPKGDAQAGRYNTKNAPFQKDIMDAITDPQVINVVVMSSAQIGKSLIMKSGIGYFIDHEPSTQMVILPTVDLGERFSKTSLVHMINDVQRVHDKVSEVKSRDSNNTICSKSYPGGDLIISGANSPSTLAQVSRRIIWMDEIDRFPESAGDEGDPVALAKKRTNAYWNKKHIMTSTPTIKNHSKIEDEFQKGTMEEWSVACPECGEFQKFDFKNINFETVTMTCIHCGCISSEKKWKKSPQKWIAEHPERKRTRSFHLNELASPFKEWQEIIDDFKDANEKLKKQHNPQPLKVFINTSLGETWDDTMIDEDAVDTNKLESRAEYYGAEIPDGVIVLTAAVDTQDDRFEVEIKGWARDYESWGIYKTEIYGDLKMNQVWDELEDYLSQTLEFADGRELGISAFTIDSGGHHTNKVYKWSKAMKKKGKKCYAIKGYSNKQDIPLIYKRTVTNIKENIKGKDVVVDQTVIHVLGVDAGKEDISNRLKIQEPGEGYCHFPAEEGRGYDEKYYKGLTSEHKVVKQVKGKLITSWVHDSSVRNEPFDLFNYNYAALELLNPNWDVLEEKIKQGINYMKKQQIKPKQRRNQKGIEL